MCQRLRRQRLVAPPPTAAPRQPRLDAVHQTAARTVQQLRRLAAQLNLRRIKS